MRSLWEDLAHALRLFVKSPGFTAVATLTIALGIGANSTIFSWINSTMLNPIPGMKGSGEVVSLSLGGTSEDPRPFSYPDYIDLRDHDKSFSGLLASSLHSVTLTGNGKPQRVWATVCSANYFDVLGVRPILGRGFLPAEDTKSGTSPVVVIGCRVWQMRYGSKPDIIGQSVSLNQHPYTIVGVTPSVFQGGQTGLRTELWIPLLAGMRLISATNRLENRDATWLMVLGRLRPGATAEQRQAGLKTLIQQMVTQYPEAHQGRK